MERRQAPGDLRDDGLPGAVGAADELAGTARVFLTSWEAVFRSVEWFVEWGLQHRQLCGVESIGVDEIHWGRGLRADNFLTVIYQIDAGCRRLLWVGQAALASHAASRSESTRAGSGPGVAVCVQRYVETVSERHRGSGWSGVACAGSFPHHWPSEPGRGSGAARRKHTPPVEKQERRAKAQAHALVFAAPGQSGARTGSREVERSARQQAGYGASLGLERDLLLLLALPVAYLGGRFSGLWVLPRHAKLPRTDEEGGPHAARPRGTDSELVSGKRRNLQWRCRGSQQQNPSDHQTFLRLSHLPRHGNRALSHLGATT